MARTKRGAAKAAPNSLFVWIDAGPNRRRLISRSRAKVLGIKVADTKTETSSATPSAPTKKELLARAAELNVDVAALGNRPTNAAIAEAIAKAEAAQ